MAHDKVAHTCMAASVIPFDANSYARIFNTINILAQPPSNYLRPETPQSTQRKDSLLMGNMGIILNMTIRLVEEIVND